MKMLFDYVYIVVKYFFIAFAASWLICVMFGIEDKLMQEDKASIQLDSLRIELESTRQRLEECQQTSQDCYVNLELLKRACSGAMKNEPLNELKTTHP